jgi:hypothetical protein
MILSDGSEIFLDWIEDADKQGIMKGVLLVYSPITKTYIKIIASDKELELLSERVSELTSKILVNNETY